MTAPPIAATLARIDATLPYDTVAYDPDTALPTVADLCANGGAGIHEQMDVLGRYLKTDDGDIPPALGAMGFPLLAASVALAAWLRERRLPDLVPATTAYAFTDYAYPATLICRSARFWALPDNPDVGHPDATVVADDAALLRILRDSLFGHLDPVLRAMRSRGARISLATMRRSAIECCIMILGQLCEKDGRLAELPDLTRTIFAEGGADNPLLLRRLPVVVTNPTRTGLPHVDLKTTTCCLRFRIPGSEPCPACPNQPDAEREARLASWAATLG